MFNRTRHKGIGKRALGVLWVFATVAALGCGDDGDGLAGPAAPGPSDPGPSDPGPSDPGSTTWPGPAPLGEVMYAVDLGNNFLVFGSGGGDELTAKMKITGVPILKRIIGIALRPSDGKLYGIGNDSRVYTIDPLTARATPVSSEPFTPQIASLFDIHFALDLEPNGDRVRLVAAESGGNWSISLDDGSAVLEANARYATGTPLQGQTPRLLGLVYPTLPDSARQSGWCANLAYAIDADEAIMIASCDPAEGHWWPTVAADASAMGWVASTTSRRSVSGAPPKAFEELKEQLLRCGEFLPRTEGSESAGERAPTDDRVFGPRTPDTEFWVFLVEVGTASNRVGVVKPFDTDPFMLGVTFHWDVPSDEPIQSVEWVPQPYVPPQALWRSGAQLSIVDRGDAGSGSAASAPPPSATSGVRCG